MRVFQPAQYRALQQRLMDSDGLSHLSLLPIQVAEDHVNLENIVAETDRLAQLFDRQIDLVRDEKVQTEDVVRRLARAAPVDPAAVAQLVSLPRLADSESGQ